MKKLLLVALAVLLAVPAISNAGAVNNKWDMTIGGHILMQAGWYDQNQNAVAGFKSAFRRGSDEQHTNNMNWYSEGRLNFMVKGPDTLGAKSSGRLEFDFLSPDTKAVLRHAYMQLDWANDTLLIGNTWYGWMATIPAGGFTLASLPNAAVASRSQQVRWDHRFGKTMKASFGVENPASNGGWMTGASNAHTQSLIPDVFGVFEYKTDSCGRIGPNMLTFGVSGVYGREKLKSGSAYTTAFNQEDIWGGAVYTYIPIIPERQNNKAGALGLSIGGMTGQGINKYMGIIPDYSLTYAPAQDDISRQRGYGWWALAEVYATNTVKFAFAYTDQASRTSRRFRLDPAGNLGAPANTQFNRQQLFNIALFYDPSPAVRFGFEAGRIATKYNSRTALRHHDAQVNMYRFFAGYYF